MERVSGGPDLLDIVHQSARKGTLLFSCNSEVKELMHQIDVLLTKNLEDAQKEKELLKEQLQTREKEITSLRVHLKEKTTQIKRLQDELVKCDRQLKVKTSDLETQLLRLRTELNRLNKSYEKLKATKTKTQIMDERTQTIQCLEEKVLSYEEEIESLTNDNMKLTRTITALQEQLDMRYDDCYDDTEKQKKIKKLKKERDIAREQTRNSLKEIDKWYNKSNELMGINRELELRVSAMNKEMREDDIITNLRGIIEEKDSIIKKMEEDHQVQLHSEEMYHQQLVKTLQMTIETLTLDENKLKEKYRALKNKFDEKEKLELGASISLDDLKRELNKREKELDECKQKLKLNEGLLLTSEDKVLHLEELLMEATSQANSNNISRTISETTTTGGVSNTEGGVSSSEGVGASTSDGCSYSKSVSSYSESSNRRRSGDHTSLLLAGFEDKISTLLSNHFERIINAL
ncbi:PREDICTED: centrosomal protein of 63 kDa-B-like isoform X2 [Amphimedon queenslandica]|uniref:CEP63/Deup1 N-terminal domain-containing protein n=1 Tax=Amphimedon queenslandica TaxID=400682 RepID=A0A1X7U251_AMPQE|nr:PREDICTED: centrosomal protein of 63 kDa-B-like isoform X2 [Amphimedon queenslandica]|eukprot:XP_019856538.1 PREDICTED: centrosomal protein of 63 kDa-B-like isoform X2 [Amphimedon queenslandica]